MTHFNPYENSQERPNVIWVMVDQMRAQALSIAGDPNVHTPNLDRLARDGSWFKNAISGFPLCCPARGSFITGKYPHKCVPGHEFQMNPAHETIADPFNKAGYKTRYFGKWHLDGWCEREGRAAWHTVPHERRGRFQTWLGYDNNNAQYDCWLHGHNDDEEISHYKLPGHENDELTNLLLKQIEKDKNHPFFHVLSVQPPHNPYSAPAEFAQNHNAGNIQHRANVPPIERIRENCAADLSGYYALIEHIDAQVGRIIASLEQNNLVDKTFIVFFSDHGDQHGSHGFHHKMTPLEESIRVPLMIWGGERYSYKNSPSTDHVVNHIDIPTTTLGLCGLKFESEVDGYDYSPVCLAGKQLGNDVPEAAYLQCVVPTQHAPSIDLPWRGITTRNGWKYVALEGQPLYLFNLNEDPYELHNMAHHAHARTKRHEMNQLLQSFIDKTGDEFSLPEFTKYGNPVASNAIHEKFVNNPI